jgi:glycosyltransferase involved in cell wall biosynthesis
MHTHYSIPHSLSCHLAKEISTCKFKTITTIHDTDTKVVEEDKPLYPLNRFSLLKSDVITTVSKYQRKHTLEYFNLDKDIEVIYNFIDTEAFHPRYASLNVRRRFAKDSEKTIMHISNFREPKNTEGV